MNPQAQNYLRTKVLTATPEQLQLMLYDGAIRFAEQGRLALAQRNFEQSYTLITRVQKIILEMSCTLKPDVSADLCRQLSALYNYVYRKLVEANVEHRIDSLDEVITLLKYQRETWALLLEQLGRHKATSAAAQLDLPAPNERMEASLSMQG
jgi:flagellar secretion chaperone FliS